MLLQTQLTDIKKVNEDLYEKLRAAEASIRILKIDAKTQNEAFNQEITQLNSALDSFKVYSENIKNSNECESELNSSEILQELRNKTQQYMDVMFNLSATQQELTKEREKIASLERKCLDLSLKVTNLEASEQSLKELRKQYEVTNDELRHCKQALGELGDHLSKMKIIELEEEILPVREFSWVSDNDVKNCKQCDTDFSLVQRKHHCRRCGFIFCNECSNVRVKLPSNPKPVRVCTECYIILKNKQFSSQSFSTS